MGQEGGGRGRVWARFEAYAALQTTVLFMKYSVYPSLRFSFFHAFFVYSSLF